MYQLIISYRALKAGIKNPVLILPSCGEFKNCEVATLLGALEALYVVCSIFLYSRLHLKLLK
jgi:hypothetical protein